jgi:Protein of unknown function (DUF1631)
MTASTQLTLTQRALGECRTAMLETLTEVLQIFKYVDGKVLNATLNAAGEQFDQLAGLRDRKSFESQRGLTASRISLVHEEDLEFSIRLSDLAQQLRENCEQPLSQLHLRFMTLLDQQEAAPEQLPLGPETICSALRVLTTEAKLNPDHRISMLQEMRWQLTNSLRRLYESLNTRLEEMGVEQKSFTRSPAERASRAAQMPNPVLATAPAPAHALEPLLAGALREHMISWLEDQLAAGGTTQIARQLSRTELAGQLPAESRAAVDCVELALERLANHDGIPFVAKQALEGLRVPLLKLALREPQLREDAEHPARRLLLALGREAAELPVDATLGSTQLNLIEACVSRLTREYKEDPSVFSDILAVLDSARAERLAALERRARQHAESISREERKESTRLHASKAIRALCAQDPPRFVRHFLEHYWSVLLRRTLLHYGERSTEWKQSLKVADALIWSTQAKQDEASRNKQIELMPRLLRHLQSGLDAIGVSAETRDRLLGMFSTLHEDALQGRNSEVADTESSPAVETSKLENVAGSDGLQIQRRVGFQAYEPSFPPALSELSAGAVLRFVRADGQALSGTIALIGPQQQVFILLTRPENQLFAMTATEIAHQYAARTLNIARTPQLFD